MVGVAAVAGVAWASWSDHDAARAALALPNDNQLQPGHVENGRQTPRGAESTELPSATTSPATATDTTGRHEEPTRLDSALPGVPASDLPLIEPPTPPDEDVGGVLLVAGASFFDVPANGRAAFVGQATEGEGLFVVDVDETGFWVRPSKDADDRVFVGFGESSDVALATGDHVALDGLIRTVPDDFEDDRMSREDLGELRHQQIYVYALAITVSP